jgi:uroporphyrinogen decarboxylase
LCILRDVAEENKVMTRRERVLAALSFQPTDQLPKDLAAMPSTGISCFAYPKLVAALGLPARRPRVHDTGQMLALPERDVLDALDCDLCTVNTDQFTNAFDEPERWHPFDFNGRLPALVQHPEAFAVRADGVIVQGGNRLMGPDAFVFDVPGAGEALDLDHDPQPFDLAKTEENLRRSLLPPERVASIASYCARARAATDRAIMFLGLHASLGFHGGMARFSMLCLTQPEHIHAYHDLILRYNLENLNRLLPAIAPHVDVLMVSANDAGIQTGPILPPAVFHDLFVPYYRRFNDRAHQVAPRMKTFLHCCGAVYDLLDSIMACGFDALNPVQWSAGKASYGQWKDRVRGRMALWGGGVNTQTTLPFGTVQAVEREVRQVVPCLAQDSGYVFCAIHNLLAEVPPEKVLALYRTAKGCGA